MTKKRAARFDYAAITERIEKARIAKGMPVKDLLAATEIQPFAWYKKLTGRGSSFSLAEFGRIADALDAPPAWPFVEWEAAEFAAKVVGR